MSQTSRRRILFSSLHLEENDAEIQADIDQKKLDAQNVALKIQADADAKKIQADLESKKIEAENKRIEADQAFRMAQLAANQNGGNPQNVPVHNGAGKEEIKMAALIRPFKESGSEMDIDQYFSYFEKVVRANQVDK